MDSLKIELAELRRDYIEPYLTAIDIKFISFYRDPESRSEAFRVIVGRGFLIPLLTTICGGLDWLFGTATADQVWFYSAIALLLVWTIVPIICMYFLNPLAFVSMLSFVISTPLGIAAFILFLLYKDLHLDRILTGYFLDLFAAIAVVALPISFLSSITTTWCIFRAQPYLSWSIAGFGKHVLEALIGFKVAPVLGAVLLWVVAPTVGQYMPDGAFWARVAGISWIVFTMPSIFWKAAEKILTGLDHVAKRKRTRSQHIYGADGFASPYEAARAMSSEVYDG